MKGSNNMKQTLLVVMVMIASAILPMMPEAAELMNKERAKNTDIMVETYHNGSISLYEGDWFAYEISIEEAPNGVLVVTPTTSDSDTTFWPAYLKFTKQNWEWPQEVWVLVEEDDDGADETITISHPISGTDTVFDNSVISDVVIETIDMDFDFDGDGLYDEIDDDDDGDGVDDDSDVFPYDANESADNDGDGIGDNADLDDDNDGYSDDDENNNCHYTSVKNYDSSDSTNASDTPLDTDGDGVCDLLDDDDDNDGYNDSIDWDTLNASEWSDTDGDGYGDNIDDDADNDTWSDDDEVICGSDILNSSDSPLDTDGDGVCDIMDIDDDGDAVNDSDEESGCDLLVDCDGDGVDDTTDVFDSDENETTDFDGDGVGDNADSLNDSDFDGDGVNNTLDAFDSDPEAWDDTDGDGLADTFPNLLVNDFEVSDTVLCSMSTASSSDDTDGDGYEDEICTFTASGGANITFAHDYYGYESMAAVTTPSGDVIDLDVELGFASYGSSTYYLQIEEAGSYTMVIQDSYGDGGQAALVYDLTLVGQVVPSSSEYGTNLDNDDDNDTFSDADEGICGSDSLNGSDTPLDTDGDGLCDAGVDDDDDNDGVNDTTEDTGCSLITDCDGDGVSDDIDSHDSDANESVDSDGDGIGDNSDSDVDGDGYGNDYDEFPTDSSEWADNDGDGVGDNSDEDDDTCDYADGTDLGDTDNDNTTANETATCGTFTGLGSSAYDFFPGDGVNDSVDLFPFNPAETADNDGDGFGNNMDYDDDNDGIGDGSDDDMDGDGWSNDDEDTNCAGDGGDSTSNQSMPADLDSDGICDAVDTDTDGDGTDDANDAFDEDPCADTDTDGDGMPDTIVTGCVTTLTEDLDDDYDSSQAPSVSFVITVDDQYGDGNLRGWGQVDGVTVCGPLEDYYGLYDTSCTVTLFAGEVLNVSVSSCDYYDYANGEGSLSVDDGFTYNAAGDASCYYATTAGQVIVHTIEADDYITAVVWDDAAEAECGTNSADSSEEPLDTDGDGLCDEIQDDDNDGDGWTNDEEITDCGESNDANDSADSPTDTDGDGLCNGQDSDDDGDGFSDSDETGDCNTDSLDNTSFPTDTDSDGLCNGLDTDDDNDGVEDSAEANGTALDLDADGTADGLDCTLLVDCDGDGVDDSLEANTTCAASVDCDGDGVNDSTDLFPEDSTESVDTDGDGIGDNADTDDDADGYSDAHETTDCDDGGTYASTSDPLNGSDTPSDLNGDGTCDALDPDMDGDFIGNDFDQCPYDGSGWTNSDNDTLCDESDADDDNDGWNDTVDCSPYDASEYADNDGDGVCDGPDADDDNDGVDDTNDQCPFDASGITDTDGDGACDESDSDDDGDGVLDTAEDVGCDLLADCDGDGVGDSSDDFDLDPEVTTDSDGDGLADSFVAGPNNFTIDTQSNAALTVTVLDAQSSTVLCTLITDSGGVTSAGTDTANASDSCNAEADGIVLEVSSVSYYTYYGAFFDYWSPNIVVSVGNDTIREIDATYTWYTSTSGGDSLVVDTVLSMTSAGTEIDLDDDDDGYSDWAEDYGCDWNGHSMYASWTPSDNDGDFICDVMDDDDDNDGYSDAHEADCGTDSTVAGDVMDNDADGSCDEVDSDDDNDGTDDTDDWAPMDASEDSDTDLDGIGDNADDDSDGDGIPNADDAEPTDRCAWLDSDGDGMVDDLVECSEIGFYSTMDKDASDNAGVGFEDGDMVGITDSSYPFGGAADGDQWFAVSGTDGVFTMYFDSADDVDHISLWAAFASTEWESEDWFEIGWLEDNGTHHVLQTTYEDDIDDLGLEYGWDYWEFDVPGDGSGQLVLTASTDSPSELFGLDNVAYLDDSWELLAMTTFEDSVESMGLYQSPSDPVEGTYRIDVYDSYGDGGHQVTATMNGDTLCDIGQGYYSSVNCTFSITALTIDTLEVSVDTDTWAYEGMMVITFPDGSNVTEYWSSDTTFYYAHSGMAQLDLWGEYFIDVYDSYGDGGHAINASFDGETVCVLEDVGYWSAQSCSFNATGFTSADLVISVDTDSYPSEGSMDVTLPDGTVESVTWSSDTTLTWTLVPSAPASGEVILSNAYGAIVAIDVGNYWQATVDDDDDNDGALDEEDAFPLDSEEWDDLDGDGIGSNADFDDDGDGVRDRDDPFPRHASAWADSDGDGMPDDIHMIEGVITDDFSSADINGMDWTIADSANNTGWQVYGDASWVYNGAYQALIRSPIGDNESLTASITLETIAGYMSFDYMVSSEESFDTLSFAINGMEYMSESGQHYDDEYLCALEGPFGEEWIPGSWVNDGVDDCGDADSNGIADDEEESSWYSMIEDTFVAFIPAGEHTFTWTYSKDNDSTGGSDFAAIDNVQFPYVVMGDDGECPLDADGNETDMCNVADDDDDNDGISDELDGCPTNPDESSDLDGDGFCDDQDNDDDGDGVYDYNDLFPTNSSEWADADGDEIGDNADLDDDNDGYNDTEDALPYDPSEWSDLDGDGVGDNSDLDLDGDNVFNDEDPFPLQMDAWLDNDGDGIPDFTGSPVFRGDFETATMPPAWMQYEENWQSGTPLSAGHEWFVQDQTVIDGLWTAQSGDIDNYESTSFVFEFVTMNGTMTFDYETSTESNWDFLVLCVDKALTLNNVCDRLTYTWRMSGLNSGTASYFIANAGFHTFEFMYYKDTSVSSWDDTVWVDNIEVPTLGDMNNSDLDDDNDGVHDDDDIDPLNPCVSLDSDGDGMPDDMGSDWINMSGGPGDGGPFNIDCAYFVYLMQTGELDWAIDEDDDNDGWGDEYEMICGSDSLNNTSIPDDGDGDGICDVVDVDWDNDGVSNTLDAFPFNATESSDADGDGIGDVTDQDDDNDGVLDSEDAFPLDPMESSDLDGDGIGDNTDSDIDGDGVDNVDDAFDSDAGLSADNDDDGIGDEADTDDDNDGVPDSVDLWPFDASESADYDGDGTGDNADTDDDGDGVLDDDDAFPFNDLESVDTDGDGIGDNADNDDDGDNYPDIVECPDTDGDGIADPCFLQYDATESKDTDGDGVGDVADNDDDEDGVLDDDDLFPYDATESTDMDGDGIGDNSDQDKDGDDVPNTADPFPEDDSEWIDTDGDGTGDNTDTDDDGDGINDDDEAQCGTDSKSQASKPSDFDDDGVCDAIDDTDSRTNTGEYAQPELGWSNAVPGFPALLAAISLLGAAVLGRRKED